MVHGMIEVTTSARPKDYEASISIMGTKGTIQIGGIAVNQLEQFSMKERDIGKFSEKVPDAYGFGHCFYKDVVKSLINKKKFPIDLKNEKTLRLLHSFYSSNEKKKEVIVQSKSSRPRG